LVFGIGQLPYPDRINSDYYMAASAVMPLLLIAVLSRLADNRLASTGLVARAERMDDERRTARNELQRMIGRLDAMKGELAKREPSPEVSTINEELADTHREALETVEAIEDDPPFEGLDQFALASILSVVLVTVIAGIGEGAAFSQLAAESRSQTAFSVTTASMVVLFLAVIYFEALPWALIRHTQRRRQ
jgi:hypothetical protein